MELVTGKLGISEGMCLLHEKIDFRQSQIQNEQTNLLYAPKLATSMSMCFMSFLVFVEKWPYTLVLLRSEHRHLGPQHAVSLRH